MLPFGMGDCEANQSSLHEALWFMNVHLEAPLLMYYKAAACGTALSPPGNEGGAPA